MIQGVIVRVTYVAFEAGKDSVEVLNHEGELVVAYRYQVEEDKDREGLRHPSWEKSRYVRTHSRSGPGDA